MMDKSIHGKKLFLQANGQLPPAIFVHEVSGMALCYRTLANLMGQNRPFIGIQSDVGGRKSGDLLTQDIPTLATNYLNLIQAELREDCILGGWSFGSIVAYEMATQVQQNLGTHVKVVLIDPPIMETKVLDPTSRTLENKMLIDFSSGIMKSANKPSLDWSSIDINCSWDAMANLLVDGMTKQGLVIRKDNFVSWYSQYKVNLLALRMFRPANYPESVELIIAEEKSELDIQRIIGYWSERVNNLHVSVIQGDHYSILRDPYVMDLVGVLNNTVNY